MIYLELLGLWLFGVVVIFFTSEAILGSLIGLSLVCLIPFSIVVWTDLRNRSKDV